MSEFYMSGVFLDRKHLFTQYYSIISCLSLRASEVRSAASCLQQYSGFGIESQIKNLNNYYAQLTTLREEVRTEYNSLVKIIDTVNSYEKKAKEIFSGGTNEYDMTDYTMPDEEFITSIPDSKKEMLVITHEDWEKLVNQFKYYSTLNENTKKFYQQLIRMRDADIDFEMTRECYDVFKNTFNMLIHKDNGAAYVYSDIEFYEPDTEAKISGKKLSAEASAEISAMNFVKAYGYGGDTSEFTIKIGAISGTASAEAKFLTSSASLSNKNNDYEQLIKDLKNAKSSEDISAALFKVGISVKGDISGIEVSCVTTKKIKDNMSFYDETKVTIGELYAEAGVNTNISKFEAKIGAGANIATVETSLGIITNDGKYALKGGLNAGVEWALKYGSETEVQIALAKLGLTIDEGFNYYVWK